MVQIGLYKYFIGYFNNDTIELLHIYFPKIIDYLSIFNNCDMNISFKVANNKKLFKKYTKIWKKSKFISK